MKITSSEIRTLFPAKVDKLLFSKEWMLPTDEQIDKAIAEILAERKIRHSSDSRVIKDKVDCARKVLVAVAKMSEYDWAVALVQLPGHAVLMVINDKKKLRFIEMLDGVDIDQKLKKNLILMV